LIRLDDMEGHFSVVWCNFRVKDEFNRKILTDTKKFRTSAKKAIFRKFQRYFAEIVNPGHRNRKNHVPSILHEDQWFSAEEAKEEVIYNYYKDILGTAFQRLHSLHLDDLLPQLDLTGIDACFSEEEVWAIIKELPTDRGIHEPFLQGCLGSYKAWHHECFQCSVDIGCKEFQPPQ